MAEGDANPMEDKMPSSVDNNIYTPEDVEWVDSCLEDVPESTDIDWNAFKEVLMEIPVLYPEPTDSSSPTNQTIDSPSLRTTDHTDFPSTKSLLSAMLTDISELSSSTMDDDDKEDSEGEEGSPDIDEIIRRISAEKLKVKSGAENAMLEPTADELGNGVVPGVVPSSSSLYGEEDDEPSISEIFRVWDLGVSRDVDEFIAQMNKELADVEEEDPTLVAPQRLTSFGELVKEPVDELVIGFSDLNLS